MIWDTSKLTVEQSNIVLEADRRSRFNFDLLLPGLKKSQGSHRTGIPVEFTDLSRFAEQAAEAAARNGHAHINEDDDHAHLLADSRARVLGLAWYSGKVSVDSSLSHALALEVFLAEGAHMIDFFWMTNNDRAAIAQSLHPTGDWQHDQHGWFEERGDADYNDWPGENFMDLFMLAATDVKPTMAMRWSHPITEAAINATRIVLERGFKAPEPAPVPPPNPPETAPVPPPLAPKPPKKKPRAWAYRGSYLYHTRVHRGSNPNDRSVDRSYATAEEARADDLRLCTWCRLNIGKLP